MQNIALGWLAFELTDSERFVGLVAFAAGVPFIIVSIPGGALLDRFDRRTVLLICQALAVVVAVVVAADVLSGNVEASIVPRLVAPRDLQNALGLMSAGGNMTRVFGPAVAGTLIAALGTGYPFLVQAIAVTAAFSIVLTSDFPRAAPSTGRVGLHMISEGARIIRNRPDLSELFLLCTFPSLLIFPYISFLNVYADEIMHIGSGGLGVLLAASGSGAVIGGLLIASTKTNVGMGKRLYRLTTLYCALLLTFSLQPVLALALPVLMAAGLVGSYAFSGNNALIQQRIDDDVRGRVMGTYLLTWGLMPIGALWMGEVAELTSIQAATAAGSGICLIATIVLRFRSRGLHLI